MIQRIASSVAIAGLLAGLLVVSSPSAHAAASLTIDASVGGAPTGVSYANFDDLPLGSAGGDSGGIAVSYLPDGQTVVGSLSGVYAAPFISNGNGGPFGDPTVSGQDGTRYLSSGIGQVTLTFLDGPQMYLGLLWGSVDSYNTLTFYDGAVSIGSITGDDVTDAANGDQGVGGTYYVNITSDLAFDRVVATSSQYAFEIDNVAYNMAAVPEPATFATAGLGVLMGLGYAWRRRRAA